MKKIIFFAIIALLLAACKDEIPPEVPEKPKNMEFYDARWAMYYRLDKHGNHALDTIIVNKNGTLSDGRKKPMSLIYGTWSYYGDSSVIEMKYTRDRIIRVIVNYEIDSLTHFNKPALYKYGDWNVPEVKGTRIEDF